MGDLFFSILLTIMLVVGVYKMTKSGLIDDALSFVKKDILKIK